MGVTHNQMPALTGVRFPLALWVVAHHLSGPGRPLDPLTSASPVLRGLIEAAWVALSAFFALSGFLLALRYRAAVWTLDALTTYGVTRLVRIYPIYLFSLVLLIPIIGEAMTGNALGTAGERTGLVANYALLLQGWIRPAVNWNTPAWSLSCEVFFYACVPLLMGLIRTTSWPRVTLTALVAFACPVALRLTVEPPIPKALLYFGDFLIGVAAAGIYDRLSRRGPLAGIGPWLYGPAIGGGLALLWTRDALPSFLLFDSGVRLGSALLVLGLACGGGWLVRVLSSSVVLAGGRASYAIYILHVPLLWWYERSAAHAALPPAAAGLAYLALVIGLSLAVTRWYEPPIDALVRNWCTRRRCRHVADPAPVRGGSGFHGTEAAS